jgi:hypothetical protein
VDFRRPKPAPPSDSVGVRSGETAPAGGGLRRCYSSSARWCQLDAPSGRRMRTKRGDLALNAQDCVAPGCPTIRTPAAV